MEPVCRGRVLSMFSRVPKGLLQVDSPQNEGPLLYAPKAPSRKRDPLSNP